MKLGAVVFALGSGGCVVFTPPARGLALETSQPVGMGRTGEQVEVTRVRDLATAGDLRLRRGIGPDTDASAEVTAIAIPGSGDRHDRLDAWALRGGIKHRLAPGFALAGGGGAGIFSGGPFVAPDIGAIASWDNGIVEPFVSLRGSVSVILAPRDVMEEGSPRRPRTTWYVPLTGGVRVPIGPRTPRAGEMAGAVLAGVAWTWRTDDVLGDWSSMLPFGGAAEITF
jgi:hypothetical protein